MNNSAYKILIHMHYSLKKSITKIKGQEALPIQTNYSDGAAFNI